MYALSADDEARLENDFKHHPPKGNQAERYVAIREDLRGVAGTILGRCPPCRELSLALTHLEQAGFYANAAIARHERWEGGNLVSP